MPAANFILSAFGDEITDDLAGQLDLLAAEHIRYVEFRGAWGRNILDLDPGELRTAGDLLRARGFGVSAIASPVGKSELNQPAAFELERLERAIAAAQALDTRLIRVFSFFVAPEQAAESRMQVLERMSALTERARQAGMTLLHENEKGIYGDTPGRCLDIMQQVNSPALRTAFDPANFVQVGVRPMQQAWPALARYTTHVHIKDAFLTNGNVCPAGEGDGEIPELLATLAGQGYQGFLTLEPHLQIAGPAGGFSGEAGMRVAIRALRDVLGKIQ
jgi:sugar phosphate isomerase/epimerase